jgi:peptidoglycan/xylan/chitin deacetylase (PgdA/CDA1 family)
MLPLSSFPKNDGESQKNYNEDKFNSELNFLPISINNSSLSGRDTGISDSKDVSSDIEKAVIIIFDRGYENQFTNAKPILDKYGFKASFFIVCRFVDGNGMSWDQIRRLDKQAHDIESHGMEHRRLMHLSSEDLEHEISVSKECLEDQGLKPTYFQFPFNIGAHNSTVLKMISKYFGFGLSGHSRLMFLNCDGWVNHGFRTQSYKYQYDCNPFSADGTPTRTHKYAIKEWSHDREHSKLNNRNPQLAPHGPQISDLLFTEFVRVVEAQTLYNSKAGKIVAIPIIGYHFIGNSTSYDTSKELFDKEMNYLYTNGFKVLRLTDLGYNEEENHFYIK